MKSYYDLNNLISAKFVEYENGALEVKIGNTVEKFPNPDVSTACHVVGLVETIKQSKGLWEALIGETDGAEGVRSQRPARLCKRLHGLHEQVSVQGVTLQFEVGNGVTLNVTDKNVLTLAYILLSEGDGEGQKRLKEYYINMLKNA